MTRRILIGIQVLGCLFLALAICVPGLAAQTKTPSISPDRTKARQALADLRLEYSADTFVKQAWEGDLVAVSLFLAAGMSPNTGAVVSKETITVLIAAATNGHTETVQSLVAAGAEVQRRASPNGTTALDEAAKGGYFGTVQALLEGIPSLDSQSANTALFAAAREGHASVVKMLLDRGADANAAAPGDKDTPIILAACGAHTGTLRALLDKGANVNAESRTGRTPLLCAVASTFGSRRKEAAELLLERGADVGAKDRAGQTALFLAAGQYVPDDRTVADVIRLLLKRSANLDAKDALGRTPLLAALSSALSAKSHEEDYRQRVEIIGLLASRTNVDMRPDKDETALIFATLNGLTDAVKILLERGADPNLPSRNGRSALSLTQTKYPEIQEMLRKAGGKP